ncbi:MAG: FAD-dependent oxidoreductase [Deinococcales bacterium]
MHVATPSSLGTGRVLGQPSAARLALFARHDGPAVLLTTDERLQLFADALHIIPHGDGSTAIGSTSERDYDDPTETDEQLDLIIARARAAVPALAGAAVIQRWAGLRPRARSRAPILGPHPVHSGAFIANGGFKIGFGMAPKVAEVMADLMIDGRAAIPESFRPEASL